MKILTAEVEWYEGYGNAPILRVTVDELPKREDHTFDEKSIGESTLYYSQTNDGAVSYMSHSPSNEGGYGGSVFVTRMKDGSIRQIKGPWSSRASFMNNHFPHCVDVILHDAIDHRHGSAISLQLAKDAAQMAGVHLVQRESDGDIRYCIEGLPDPAEYRGADYGED